MLKITHLNISFDQALFIDQNLEIYDNCLTLITGESGCGKTTLLYQLGLIDSDLKCHYYLDYEDISSCTSREKADLRRNYIGFVFQDYMLHDHFNVYENLEYFASLVDKRIDSEDALRYLHTVHLDIPLDRPLKTLSGGQKQRLAIACILIKEPHIIILDEPTSALDQNNSQLIFEILNELKYNHMIIVSSHNKLAYQYSDEIIEIKDHQIQKIKCQEHHDESRTTLSFKESRPHTNYKYYIQKHYHSSRKMHYLLSFTNIFILLCCVIVTIATKYYEDKVKSVISEDHPAQLYIPSINQKEISNFDVDFYPYYDTQLMIYGMKFKVIPYYDFTDLNDIVWTNYTISPDKGFYFSHAMYLTVKNILPPKESIDFYTETGDLVSLKYKGILFKGVKSQFDDETQNQTENQYMLVYYKLIEEYLKPSQIKGYTLVCHSYNEYVKTKEKIMKTGKNVQVFYDIEEIEKVIQYVQYIKVFLIGVSFFIGLIMLNYVYSIYFNSRRKEISLLKCVGLTNQEISRIFMMESSIHSFFSLVLAIILAIIDFSSFGYLCLFVLCIFLSVFFIVTGKVMKINPVLVLRNE